MRAKRIYLVGFMGAGKSKIGRQLAVRLGWTFIDLDAEIEKAEKMAISEIWSTLGEPHFRRLERQHLKQVMKKSDAVIALGGGTYVDFLNRKLAESSGLTVWLRVGFDTILRRVTMDGSRPLLQDLESAKRLFETRQPLYSVAQIHVLTDNRDPDVIVEEIVDRMEHL